MSDQIALTIRMQGFAAARQLVLQQTKDASTAFWKSALWFNLWRDAEQVLLLCKDTPDQLRRLAGGRMLAGFSLLENDQMHAVYAVDWGSAPLQDLLKAKGDKIRFWPSQFRGEQVYTVEYSNGERIVLANCSNLLLFSRYSYLVEDAIAQMQHGRSWWQNRKFESVSQTKAPLYCAIRPEKFTSNLVSTLKTAWRAGANVDISPLIRWIGCSWDGKEAVGAAIPGLLSPFGKEGKIDAMATLIPDDPSLVFWARLKDKPWWLYGDQQHIYQQFIQSWVGTEIACVLSEAYGMEQCWIMSVKNKDAAARAFDHYGEKYGLLKDYDYQTYKIWHFLRPAILGAPANGKHSNVRNPACAIVEGYAIFAPNTAILETWIDKFVVSQTLASRPDWLLLRQSLPDEMQALIAVNGAQIPGLFREVFTDKIMSTRADEISLSNKLGFIAIPIQDGDKSPWHLTIWAKPRVAAEPVSSILWKTQIAAKALTPPCIFDRAEGGKHILLQDAAYQLYCLDENGQILWRRVLDGPIQSEIYNIDYLKNRRDHFLFNTAGQILLLDEQGNDVSGYPLKLQSPATNGLLVVDFDKNQQYSFFIACQNRNLYGFDQFGRPLSGWNTQSGIGVVQMPLRHLQTKSSDLIVIQNNQGQLSAFGRHGDRKFGPISMEGNFRQAPQIDPGGERIVCANSRGKLYIFNPQGEFFNLSARAPTDKAPVHTVFQQISHDKRFDFAFLNGKRLQVSGYQGSQFKQSFNMQFETPQDTLFGLPGFGLGVWEKSRSRIGLIDSKGQYFQGFPLAGSTPFAISKVSGESAILVTGNDSYVYAYKISQKLE